jgi:hypothetical protein
MLLFIIGITVFTQRMEGPQERSIETRAKLCSAYYDYVDTSHEVIKQMDTMCWRGDAPVRADQ